MKKKFFNKIHIDKYYNLSLFDKVSLLLDSGVFSVPCELWDDFNNSISVCQLYSSKGYPSGENDEALISRISELIVNRKLISEISSIVLTELKDPKLQLIDEEILSKYNFKLAALSDFQEKKDIIKETLNIVLKEISDYIKYGDFFFYSEDYLFKNKGSISKNSLIDFVEFFYSYLPDVQAVLAHSDEYEDYDNSVILSLKKLRVDAISHVIDEGDIVHACLYRSAAPYLYLSDLINTLEYFKNELKKFSHEETTKKGASYSDYSVDFVLKNENRFPSVFKNAESCELFLYILSFESLKTKRLFSHFFEIFNEDKRFKRNIKPVDYFSFIEKVYGINNLRLRKDLSSIKYNSYLLSFIHHKKNFLKLVTKGSNIAI